MITRCDGNRKRGKTQRESARSRDVRQAHESHVNKITINNNKERKQQLT